MANLFHRAFVEDFWLKLISVLLAAGLWLAVTTDPTAEVEMQVPIEFQRFPENLEIDSASFTQAQVRVRGPARLIHMLRPSDVHAEVDLSGMRPGTHTFDL